MQRLYERLVEEIGDLTEETSQVQMRMKFFQSAERAMREERRNLEISSQESRKIEIPKIQEDPKVDKKLAKILNKATDVLATSESCPKPPIARKPVQPPKQRQIEHPPAPIVKPLTEEERLEQLTDARNRAMQSHNRIRKEIRNLQLSTFGENAIVGSTIDIPTLREWAQRRTTAPTTRSPTDDEDLTAFKLECCFEVCHDIERLVDTGDVTPECLEALSAVNYVARGKLLKFWVLPDDTAIHDG